MEGMRRVEWRWDEMGWDEMRDGMGWDEMWIE